MTLKQWLVFTGTVLTSAIGAWIHIGGANPLVAGVPLLSGILGTIALFMQSPNGPTQSLPPGDNPQ